MRCEASLYWRDWAIPARSPTYVSPYPSCGHPESTPSDHEVENDGPASPLRASTSSIDILKSQASLDPGVGEAHSAPFDGFQIKWPGDTSQGCQYSSSLSFTILFPVGPERRLKANSQQAP